MGLFGPLAMPFSSMAQCGTLGYMNEFCLLERRLSIRHYKISRLVEGLSIKGGGKVESGVY